MKIQSTTFFALAAAGTFLLAAPAKAAVTTYTPGDLVLYFQNPGGSQGSDQTIMVSLGNTASVFRDASGSLTTIDIIGLGNLLSTTFGADWYDQETLYMGLAGNRGTVNSSASHSSGDPSRTLYVGQSRNGIGTIGNSNSMGFVIDTASLGTGATAINGMNSQLTTVGSSPAVVPVSTSGVDNQNPFLIPGQQGTAFGIFPGGVQQQFTDGSFGTFGAAGSVEGVLDLYRIQSRSDSVGQYGFGNSSLNGVGQYLGSVAINQAGVVTFSAVPEPSTYALIALGLVGLVIARKRMTKTA